MHCPLRLDEYRGVVCEALVLNVGFLPERGGVGVQTWYELYTCYVTSERSISLKTTICSSI